MSDEEGARVMRDTADTLHGERIRRVGFSHTRRAPGEWILAAEDSLMALDGGFYGNGAKPDRDRARMKREQKKINTLYHAIAYAIKNGQRDTVSGDMERLLDAVRERRYPDVCEVRRLFAGLITDMNEVILEERPDADPPKKCVEWETFAEMEHCIRKTMEAYRQSGREDYSFLVKQMFAYVEEHFPQIQKIAEIAEYCAVSTEYMCRLFKKETGMTINTYLRLRRMKQAKRLLRDSNLKIYEISEMVGYHNLSHFSRSFKMVYGQNPFSYRNSMSK